MKNDIDIDTDIDIDIDSGRDTECSDVHHLAVGWNRSLTRANIRALLHFTIYITLKNVIIFSMTLHHSVSRNLRDFSWTTKSTHTVNNINKKESNNNNNSCGLKDWQ